MITDEMRERAVHEYLARHLGEPEEEPPLEPLSPAEVEELLWSFNPLFAARRQAIADATSSADAEVEADAALLTLAMTDSLDSWETMSAGVWRVLSDRRNAVLFDVEMARRAGQPVMSHLPRGLPADARPRTLLLLLLLAPAGTSPRR